MWQFDSEVAEIIQRTPNIKSFRLFIRAMGAPYAGLIYFYLLLAHFPSQDM